MNRRSWAHQSIKGLFALVAASRYAGNEPQMRPGVIQALSCESRWRGIAKLLSRSDYSPDVGQCPPNCRRISTDDTTTSALIDCDRYPTLMRLRRASV